MKTGIWMFLFVLSFSASAQTVNDSLENPFKFINKANQLLRSNLDSAYGFAERALELALLSENKKAEAHCFNTFGSIHFELSKYALATTNFKKALDGFDLLDDDLGRYISLKYLATSYDASLNYDKAIDAYTIFSEKAKSKNEQADFKLAQEALGRLYYNSGNYDKALELFELQKVEAKQAGNEVRLAAIYNQIGKIYDLKNDSVSAFENYEQGLTKGISSANNDAVQGYYNNVNSFFSSRGNVSKQLDVNEQAIDYYSKEKKKLNKKQIKSKNEKQQIKDIDENLYQSNFTQGKIHLDNNHPLEAIPYIKSSIDIATDIGVLENEVQSFEALFEAYEKVGEFDKALTAYKQFIKSKDSLITEKENEKLLALRLEAQVFDRDKRIQLLKKEAELDHLQFDLALKEKEDEAKTSKTLTYSLLMGIGILLFSTIVFLKGNREKKKANKLLLLKSLRTQMNPHFIFNSLNSVNSFISQSDERSANKYLTEFSKLMRMVLENSKHDFVTMSSEIKSLELYLGLEYLRFSNKFEYEFNMEVADVDEVYVPPMLIQPYIENAVWHGLRYSENKGMLRVSCRSSNENLYWKIEDDGIGRTKSKEMKTKHQMDSKSTGMKNTEERLRIIKELYNQDISLQISDLHTDGTGTKVELVIPKNPTQ
ncbi:MAG: histidine kinase [Flavobacteriales bacterium]|nr:histidine kinase [Flavobacteriales bacterium]